MRREEAISTLSTRNRTEGWRVYEGDDGKRKKTGERKRRKPAQRALPGFFFGIFAAGRVVIHAGIVTVREPVSPENDRLVIFPQRYHRVHESGCREILAVRTIPSAAGLYDRRGSSEDLYSISISSTIFQLLSPRYIGRYHVCEFIMSII